MSSTFCQIATPPTVFCRIPPTYGGIEICITSHTRSACQCRKNCATIFKKKFDFKIFGEFLKFYIWTSRQPTGPSSFFVLSKARYTPATKSAVSATKSAVLATLSTATSCRIQVVADLSPVSATVDFVASVYRALVLV